MGNERDSDFKIFTADGKEVLMQSIDGLGFEVPECEYPKLIEEVEIKFVIKKTKNHYHRYMRWLKRRKR